LGSQARTRSNLGTFEENSKSPTGRPQARVIRPLLKGTTSNYNLITIFLKIEIGCIALHILILFISMCNVCALNLYCPTWGIAPPSSHQLLDTKNSYLRDFPLGTPARFPRRLNSMKPVSLGWRTATPRRLRSPSLPVSLSVPHLRENHSDLRNAIEIDSTG